MNTPRKIIFFISILFSFTGGYANDGAFYASGNHLIPMYESDIIVKKEILTIKRIAGDKAVITVYYEFFNPKKSKELEVGFEAESPSGDVETSPVNGHHPYITRFTVNLNGEAVPFKVAIVDDSLYFKDGKYKSKTAAQVEKENEDAGMVSFFYVYHFHALFKEGLNVLQHTYTIDLSSSVVENYDLHYILTAARRWGNRQIDDFTLQIDMGEFQDLTIPADFFNDVSEWQISGEGKSVKAKIGKSNAAEFFIRKGMIVFQKKEFQTHWRTAFPFFQLLQLHIRRRVNRYEIRFEARPAAVLYRNTGRRTRTCE